MYKPGRGNIKNRNGVEPNTRFCNLCGEFLQLECFGKHSQAPDGLNVWCKICKSARQKQSRLFNEKSTKTIRKNIINLLENKLYLFMVANVIVATKLQKNF